MGRAVALSGLSAGLQLIPVTFESAERAGKSLHVGTTEMQVYGPSERERVLSSIADEFQNLVVVDYTAPEAVNGKMVNMVVFGVE